MTILESDKQQLQQRYDQVHQEELELAKNMLLGIDQIPESIDDVRGRLNQFDSYYVALALLLKQNNLEDLALYYQIESDKFAERIRSLQPDGNGQLAYQYFLGYRDDYLNKHTEMLQQTSTDTEVSGESQWYLLQTRIGETSAGIIASEYNLSHQQIEVHA